MLSKYILKFLDKVHLSASERATKKHIIRDEVLGKTLRLKKPQDVICEIFIEKKTYHFLGNGYVNIMEDGVIFSMEYMTKREMDNVLYIAYICGELSGNNGEVSDKNA